MILVIALVFCVFLFSRDIINIVILLGFVYFMNETFPGWWDKLLTFFMN